jgi:hypothetical protein
MSAPPLAAHRLPLAMRIVASVLLIVAGLGVLLWMDKLPRFLKDLRPAQQLSAKLVQAVPARSKLAEALLSQHYANASSDMLVDVCAMASTGAHGAGRFLVAVCHQRKDGAAHAEGGLIDLLVARHEGGTWHIEQRRDGLESGAFGYPGDVSIVQLGDQWFGFAIEASYTGQGQTMRSLRLLAPVSDAFEELLSLQIAYDNEGTGACDADAKPPLPPCRRIERRWRIDPTPGELQWPIVLEIEADEGGRVTEQQHRLTYDAAAQRYPLPAGVDPSLE